MRYYSITITGAPADVFPVRYQNGAQWGTIATDGTHDQNAQQIEFQLEEWAPNQFSENSVLTIYGVSFDQIKACNQLVGKPIEIDGGMSPGLPLATFQSQREKLLLQGTILKCWGNWIGTDTSIGMAFAPSGVAAGQASGGGGGGGGGNGGGSSGNGGSAGGQSLSARYVRTGARSLDRRLFNVAAPRALDPGSIVSSLSGGLITDSQIGPAFSQFGNDISSFFGGGAVSPLSEPLNLIHNLMPNMPLSGAIQETLSKAFPNANINMLISSGLQLAYQDAGIYQSVAQYAGYINNLSQSILGTKDYPGVNLSSYNNTINVWDGTQPVSTGDISYLELIGQPCWMDIQTINVKVVLRGGLHIGSQFTLPQTLVNFAGADSQLPFGGSSSVPDQRTQVSLPGGYRITKVLHIGDFRNPDGASWSTNYEAVTQFSVTGQASSNQAITQSNQTQTNSVEPVITIRPTSGQTPQQNIRAQSRLLARPVRRYG